MRVNWFFLHGFVRGVGLTELGLFGVGELVA